MEIKTKNTELNVLVNENINEVFNQILAQWMNWVVEGEYVGGLKDFIVDGAMENMTFEIDGEEFEYYETKKSRKMELYFAIRNYMTSDDFDFDNEYC